MTKILDYGDYTVSYEETDEIKQAVFDAVLAYYKKHEAFSAECILQMDDPIIDAPSALAAIADNIIKFDRKSKD
jgi:hypothetical protein